MKAVQISRHGNPADVVELVDVPEPSHPGAGEVLIQMLYSPINHYDLRTLRGVVPGPALPRRTGSEGVARIVSVGDQVGHVEPGDLVHLPIGFFGWQERLVVPAEPLFALPRDADPKQLAMVRVNPPTAALLLSEMVELKAGDWIIQNAATSAVGRSVIAFARKRGYRTANIVRRQDAVKEIEAAGGDIVLLEQENLPAIVKEKTAGVHIPLGLDGVGGMSTALVSGAIGNGGTLAIYSAMSEKPGVANQLDILFRDVRVHGFWLAYPRLHQSGHFASAVRESAELIGNGQINTPIAAVYSLNDVAKALNHSQSERGKIMLRLG